MRELVLAPRSINLLAFNYACLTSHDDFSKCMASESYERFEQELDKLGLDESLKKIEAKFPGAVAFSTSLGQEDQVITDAIFRNSLSIRVFTLDTGRLFAETYSLIDETRARYGKSIEVFFPDALAVENLTTAKGFFSFYESIENRKECCHIRKVLPLRRALHGVRVWVTGLRSEQSVNRSAMRIFEWDENYQLFKFNPLIHWQYDDVTRYLHENNVPDNPLHRKGFVSIGCAPCTRAIEPGEHPRAGRWWWETSQKECGLHATQK
jgi:phosphoadenosine phosphosulfate reductase